MNNQRTRQNIAVIVGSASAIDSHVSRIRIAVKLGKEEELQIALADLMMDIKVLESAIVDQEQ